MGAGEFWASRRVSARLGAAYQFYFWPRVSARHEVRAGEIFFFGRVCGGLGAARICLFAAVFSQPACGAESFGCSACCWTILRCSGGLTATSSCNIQHCSLRSRSSPPLPKTTVFGAAVGALGAKKASTLASAASATISRAISHALRCRCHSTMSDPDPPLPVTSRRRLARGKQGSWSPCMSSPASSQGFVASNFQNRPLRGFAFQTRRSFSRTRS